ncbi:MAG: hypothetical protein IPM98_21095 [Lewinellaceae bacterium]|nr:hypothetical protein [Lewinellaceae bacterium]
MDKIIVGALRHIKPGIRPIGDWNDPKNSDIRGQGMVEFEQQFLYGRFSQISMKKYWLACTPASVRPQPLAEVGVFRIFSKAPSMTSCTVHAFDCRCQPW